jgi:hypothetical protein
MPPSSPTPTPESAEPTPGLPVPRHDRFANGSLKASGFELDGRLHGHWEWFRLDGTLMRSGDFHLGDQVGVWRTWDRAGRIVKETSFRAAPSGDAVPAPTDPPRGLIAHP